MSEGFVHLEQHQRGKMGSILLRIFHSTKPQYQVAFKAQGNNEPTLLPFPYAGSMSSILPT